MQYTKTYFMTVFHLCCKGAFTIKGLVLFVTIPEKHIIFGSTLCTIWKYSKNNLEC
jgi:hypothetical protein